MANATNTGASDIVLVKHEPDGTQRWATQLRTSSDDCGQDITSDASGDTILVRFTYGALPGTYGQEGNTRHLPDPARAPTTGR